MSGLEVLGATAAALQLVELSARLITTLNDLRKKMKEAPKMLSDGVTNIEEVKKIAETVGTNPALKDDDGIKDILLSMKNKATELEALLLELTFEAKNGDSRFVKSFNKHHKDLKAVKNQDRIEQLFQHLERNKSNLSLQISIIITAVQDRISHAVLADQSTPAIAPDNSIGPYYYIPYDVNPSFTGRKDILANLKKRIDAKEQRISIFGLGGIGKTNVMLEFAKQVERVGDTSIFWASGEDRDKYNQDCRAITQKLPIPGLNQASDAKVALKTWLESSSGSRWLLLIDNVDDEQVFFETSGTGLQPEALANFIPNTSNGAIIFTTRNKKVAVQLNSNMIQLTSMDSSDAVEMLRNHLKDGNNDEDDDEDDDEAEEEDEGKVEADMNKLVSELEYIPLAITQAAAYIKANSNTVGQYLKLLNKGGDDRKIDWLDRDDFNDSTRPSGSVNPIFRTWAISLSKIEKEDEGAANSLFFMSCLGRQRIPEFLLPGAGDEVGMNEALGTLKAYSFIKQGRISKMIDIHRLVHLVTREYIKKHGREEIWTQKVMDRLSEFIPLPRKQDMGTLAKLLPHVYLVAQRYQKPSNDLKIGTLYYNASYAFRLVFQFYKAAELALWDWNDSIRRLGEDNPATHISAMNYADMLQLLSRFAESEQIFRSALEGLSKYRDSNDIDIIWGKGLAACLQAFTEGDPVDKAEGELDALVAQTESLFGPNDLEVAKILFQLGGLCGFKKKMEKSAEATRRALVICENEVGPNHGWPVMARMNLAYSLQALGRHEEVNELMQKNLEISKDSAGQENRTLALLTTSSAALKLLEQGDKAAGQNLLKKALEDFKYQGQDEPDVWLAGRQIAKCLLIQDRYTEAESIYRSALEFYKMHAGSDNRCTLLVKAQLALVLQKTKQFESAIKHCQEVLASLEKDAGNSTTDQSYINVLALLVTAYEGVGQKDTALRLRRQCYEKQVQMSGPTSEKAIIQRLLVGVALDNAGMTAEAEVELREANILVLTHLGPGYEYYLASGERLAKVLADADKFAEAEAVRRDILKHVSGTEAEKDVRAVQMLRNLCTTILSQEKTDEVETYLSRAFAIAESIDLGSNKAAELFQLNQARARLLFDLGKKEEALDLYKSVLDEYEKTVPEEDMNLLFMQLDYGVHLRDAGHVDDSITILRRVLDVRTRAFGSDYASTRLTELHIVVTLRLQKAFDEAEALGTKVYKREMELDPLSLRTGRAAYRLGQLFRDMGRLDEALRYFDQTCTLFAVKSGAESLSTKRYQKERAELVEQMATTPSAPSNDLPIR